MEMILDFAKRLLLSHIKEDGIYVDFTMGNGNDTLFFAQHTKGDIYAFDIQDSALENTKLLLQPHNITKVTLLKDSHLHFQHYISNPIEAGIFNFGYLPGGDKSITTQSVESLEAVKLAISQLSDTGILVLVLYPGHEQGRQESKAIEQYCCSLSGRDYHVIKYDFINKKFPPYVLAIEKRIFDDK